MKIAISRIFAPVALFFIPLNFAISADIQLGKLVESNRITTWSFPEKKFKHVSLWKKNTAPPLSINDALRIAQNSLKDKSDSLSYISLRRPISTWGKSRYFFYFIEYDSGSCFVVLFDGSIVPSVSKQL